MLGWCAVRRYQRQPRGARKRPMQELDGVLPVVPGRGAHAKLELCGEDALDVAALFGGELPFGGAHVIVDLLR